MTKKEMEELLADQTKSILQAVDNKFARLEVRLNREHEEITRSIQKLTATLDNFIKRLTDYEDKYESLRLRESSRSSLGLRSRAHIVGGMIQTDMPPLLFYISI